MLDVKVKLLRQGVSLPRYETDGAAAVDLASAAGAPVSIPAGGRALIPTGLAIAPASDGYVALICARSGLAAKHGVALANGVGVIDADYRGEILVALSNSGGETYIVMPGERVAQLMFLPVARARLIPAETLEETDRGAGGFGSTGKR